MRRTQPSPEGCEIIKPGGVSPRTIGVSPRKDSRPAPFPSPEGCEIIKPGGVSPRTIGVSPRKDSRLAPSEPRRVRDHKAWRREPQETDE